MKCRLLAEQQASPATADDWRYFEQHGHHRKLPAGTVIDNSDAYLLVRMGIAVPEDDECAAAHGMTHEQLWASRKAAEKVALGIWPEDYAAFDAGVMRGYNPDGSFIPGPNAEHEEGDDDE